MRNNLSVPGSFKYLDYKDCHLGVKNNNNNKKQKNTGTLSPEASRYK